MTSNDDKLTSWQDIDWKSVNRQLTRLRYRIFDSCKKRDTKLTRQLQRLMISSGVNLLSSIRRVTQINTGKNTPGLDKFLVKTPQERLALYYSMRKEGLYKWNPIPVRRKFILKPDGRLYN